jgi:hypothetical protein
MPFEKPNKKLKLWQVAQWGNPDEGANGEDTIVLVVAKNFNRAIQLAKTYFIDYYFFKNVPAKWKNGEIDNIILLGESYGDGEEKVVVFSFIQHSLNLSHAPSWTKENDKWYLVNKSI